MLDCSDQLSLQNARAVAALRPDDRAQAEQVVLRDLDLPARLGSVRQHVAHLFWSVGSADGRDSVDTRHVTSHQGKTRVHKRQVEWMANQIVDQERAAADTRCFAGEAGKFTGSR